VVQIDIFQHVADVIRAVTDMFGKFTDNVANFVETGLREWDYVSAKLTHARLVNLCALFAWTVSTKGSLDLYLQKSDPTPADWKAVIYELEHVLRGTEALLGHLKRERSDLVLDPMYRTSFSCCGMNPACWASWSTCRNR
jgi:hypothetical protein